MSRRSVFAVSFVLCLAQSATARAVTVSAENNVPAAIGVPIQFSATAVGTGELSYRWDFGDGTKSEFAPTPTITHTYQTPGHYPVIVIAKDGTGVRSDSFLQTVHRPLLEAPPLSSATIVYDRERNRVCNVNVDADTISCIDTQSLTLSFEAAVGRHPRTLAIGAHGELWVANEQDSTLSVLSESGELVSTVQLPYASRPFGIVVANAGKTAYVTLQGTAELAVIDAETRTIEQRVAVGAIPNGIACDALGQRVLVTRLISPVDHGEVVEVDTTNFALTKIALSADPGPDTEASSRGVPNYLRNIVMSPDGAFAWVPSKKDNTLRGAARDGMALTFETSVRTIVSLVDLQSKSEAANLRVDLNNRGLGLSAAFSRLGDYAFVALLANNGVEVLDAYTGKIVSGLFNLGKAPDGLVLDDAGRLYLNAFLSRTVVVLDAADILRSTDFALKPVAEIQTVANELLSPEVLRGKQIFYDAADERMSKDGYISCASCHLDGFEDGRVWDFTDRGEGLRNTVSLLGRRGSGQGRLHWSANFDEVQDFEHDIRNAFGGRGFMADAEFTTGTRNTTLGLAKAGISPELDALSAFVTSLEHVNPSPFRDSDGSLSESGWRGRELFVSSGCADCHTGLDFTDSANGVLHDVGTLTQTSGKRLGEAITGIDTPTLRGLFETAPYLHDGSAATLLDVLTTKNTKDLHGRTSALSDEQRTSLVSYLLQIDNTALADEVEPVPASGDGASKDGCGCHIPKRGTTSSLMWALLGTALVFARRRKTLL